MKKLSTITFILCLFALSGCHHFGHHHHGKGEHCPPGQAKKGNC